VTFPLEWQLAYVGTILSKKPSSVTRFNLKYSSSLPDEQLAAEAQDGPRWWRQTALASIKDAALIDGKQELSLPHKSTGQFGTPRMTVRAVMWSGKLDLDEAGRVQTLGASVVREWDPWPESEKWQPIADTVRICLLGDPVICLEGSAAPSAQDITLHRDAP